MSLQEAAANLEAAAEAVANIDMTAEKDAVAGFISTVAQTLEQIADALAAASKAFTDTLAGDDAA